MHSGCQQASNLETLVHSKFQMIIPAPWSLLGGYGSAKRPNASGAVGGTDLPIRGPRKARADDHRLHNV
jgi:hypothetical protein